MRERKGRAWRQLSRRRQPPRPTHAEVDRAVARFRSRGGLIRPLPPERTPDRIGAHPQGEIVDEGLYLIEVMYASQ